MGIRAVKGFLFLSKGQIMLLLAGDGLTRVSIISCRLKKLLKNNIKAKITELVVNITFRVIISDKDN